MVLSEQNVCSRKKKKSIELRFKLKLFDLMQPCESSFELATAVEDYLRKRCCYA
jgi:hypothetical protein